MVDTSSTPVAATDELTNQVVHDPVSGSDSAGRRLLVDPSLLLSDVGLNWLRTDRAARDLVIVSQTFVEALEGGWKPTPFLRGGDRDSFEQKRGALLALLGTVPRFSFAEARLPPAAEDVKRTLLERDDAAARVFADEWTFLQAHSSMISKFRRPLTVFRDAGAIIEEYGRRLRQQFFEVVVPTSGVPNQVSPRFLAKVGAKWFIVGGSAVGGSVLGPAGSIVGLLSVPVVRALDP